MCAVAIDARGGTHLGLLRLRGHDEELRGWVDDVDLADDRGGIGGDEEAAEMVDDQLVAAWREVRQSSIAEGYSTHHWDQNLS